MEECEMCIAIAKLPNRELPSEETLKICWNNNDDGAGFAFNYDNRVFIKKGFMTFADFMEKLRYYDNKYDLKKCGMLIHFRIATHGARDASMTHPFPIIDDAGCLKKIEYVSDYAVVHNGIISLTSSSASKSDGLSDTALFIKDYLTKIAQNKSWLRKECNMELIEKLIGSKMAILDKTGHIEMTSGFTEENGVFYSNSSYKDTWYTKYGCYYTGNSCYGSYYDYNDYGSYDDYIANKIDDSKHTSSKNYKYDKLVGIMEIPVGSYIECEGYSEEVINNDSVKYFIDENYSLYICSDGDDVDKYNRDYFYFGEADVYDKNFKTIEFKRTDWAFESQLQPDEEDYYDELPETETK
jgi:predicted glutamine amidotransferase